MQIHRDARAWTRVGNDMLGQHKGPEAEAAFRHALQMEPKNPWTIQCLGAALCLQRKYREAEAAYRSAVKLVPDDGLASCCIGCALYMQRKYREAEAAFRSAIKLDTDDLNAWFGVGAAELAQHHYPEAEAAFRRANEVAPKNPYALYRLGAALSAQHKGPEGEEAFRGVIKLGPEDGWDPMNAWRLCIVDGALRAQHEGPEAEATYRRAVELHPEDPAAWSGLAGALSAPMRFPTKEAETAYRRAIKLDPQNPWLWSALGRVLSRRYENPDAEEAFSRAVELYTEEVWTSRGLGAWLSAQREDVESVAVSEHTQREGLMRLKSFCTSCGKQLGLLRSLSGRRICPDCETLHKQLADQQASADRQARDEAIATYRAAIEKLWVEFQGQSSVNVSVDIAGLSPEDIREINRGVFTSVADESTKESTLHEEQAERLFHFASGLGIDSVAELPEVAHRIIVSAINGGHLPTVEKPSAIVHVGETVFAEAQASLLKEVAIREFQGGSSGISVPLGKGFRYRVGSVRGRSVVVGTQMIVQSSGTLTITSRRIVFAGDKRSAEIPLSKLVGLQLFSDAIRLNASNRQLPLLFAIADPETFGAIVNTALQRFLNAPTHKR